MSSISNNPEPAVPQRVLLWRVSHLLGDLIDVRFAIEPAVVVGEVGAGESVGGRITETQADVLLASQGVLESASEVLPLLRDHPFLRVIVLRADDHQALLYELLPVVHDLNGISAPRLLRAVLGEI